MNDNDAKWVARYRTTITDDPTPALDEWILRAASRRTQRARVLRGGVVMFALAAAITVLLVSTRESEPEAMTATGYGLHEGATLHYLMNPASASGPANMESIR